MTWFCPKNIGAKGIIVIFLYKLFPVTYDITRGVLQDNFLHVTSDFSAFRSQQSHVIGCDRHDAGFSPGYF